MTSQGVVVRDATVIDTCVDSGIPVVVTLGGGYSDIAWEAQYASIRRTITQHGLVDGQWPYPPREPTAKEKLHTK